ncbi:MAG TPA: crosslink repair DNA glycosylase YcaQ family protein [Patescibacteria group bacterium]|nr:crosslink repair DNA glycosylase YcaQ family protein [Patescibacteria group bacterium]
MPTQTLSAAVARRFLVIRHLLAPARSLPPTEESALAVVDSLGSLQFDPLEVAGRNHDLVLHARVAGYRRAWTDRLLYERRLLFEAYNKGLSILPTRELPWHRLTWDRARRAHEGEIFTAHGDHVAELLDRIRRGGPISAADLDRSEAIAWYWGPTLKSRAVLEALAEAGILGIARRDGNRRCYDLVERIFPAGLLAERIPEREQMLHRLLSRYRAHGLLGSTGPGEIFVGFGPGELLVDGSPRPRRAALLAELVERGELLPVAIEGIRGVHHVITDELPLLAQAEREVAEGGPPGGEPPSVTFLAPLDPLAWDRDLLRSLFGFDYVWEVYVPAAKRRWGYYVLPLLFGDRFVGRIEPRFDRPARAVRILGLWWEAGFDPFAAGGFVPAISEALDAYRAFHGATRVTFPRNRAGRGLAGAVRRAR